MQRRSTLQSLLRRFGIAALLGVFGLGSIAIWAGSDRASEDHHDHVELIATLDAPFEATGPADSRAFNLRFEFPDHADRQAAHWVLTLLTPDGTVVESWHGTKAITGGAVTVTVPWAGRVDKNAALPDGLYRAHLQAYAADPRRVTRAYESHQLDVADAADKLGAEYFEQVWEFKVGNVPMPEMPAFAGLSLGKEAGNVSGGLGSEKSAPALNSLPYRVYFANLHSQTNDSDGGGAVATCTSSQAAQSGQFGPADAFVYGKNAGLDILATTEHNHYFDGSSGTNSSANPTTAKNRFNAGLTAAANFNAANPNFLAVYGLEWGVISNGGHLNIFNTNELLAWEYNSSSQLIGHTFTAKSDYAALYALMKQKGWIGQFNHPETSGQFLVGGQALGYSPDGDEVMVLAEVLNTSAFSNNTTETESGRSSYESAFNKILERGFHVAPATNQDNHCANWGSAYTNRTGVLIPNGTALSQSSFVDALRARRVYATMDKNSQLVLTGNGNVMGTRFNNSGTLNLTANFASTTGKTVQSVTIYEGVPGRNGTVTSLTTQANHTFTPAVGQHFYYAKITQNDGKMLWSAPIWVNQTAGGGDTTAPTVSGSVTGTSGIITFNATASDAVGVTKVEFLVNGSLKGSDTTSPYSLAFNSATLSNGSHTLTAKAYDAAGNIGTSAPVAFSVSNGSTPTELVVNGSFESGAASWTATSGVITNDSGVTARTGTWKAWLNGYGSAHTDTLYQQVAIPVSATTATLNFWLKISSDETTTTQAYDTLKVQVRSTANAVLATLATYSNLNKGTVYVQRTFDLSAYKGQTVRVYFEGIEGSQVATSFIVDDVSVVAQ